MELALDAPAADVPGLDNARPRGPELLEPRLQLDAEPLVLERKRDRRGNLFDQPGFHPEGFVAEDRPGLLAVAYQRRRDPPGRVIIPEYEMPPGQSAAAMRYLLRMDYDDKTFAAGVLSLAVKGYLRIEQSDGILGFGKKFSLIKEPKPAGGAGKPLSSDEQALLATIFSSGCTS